MTVLIDLQCLPTQLLSRKQWAGKELILSHEVFHFSFNQTLTDKRGNRLNVARR